MLRIARDKKTLEIAKLLRDNNASRQKFIIYIYIYIWSYIETTIYIVYCSPLIVFATMKMV